MLATELTIAGLSDACVPVLRRHGIQRAVLFGSLARGEPSPHSDVDMILVVGTRKRFLDRYDPILGELNSLLPGIAFEPLIYTPEEFEAMRRRPFIAKALREGVTILEQD